MTHGRQVPPGGTLFHEGDPVVSIVTVTSGMVKLYKLFEGRRQIIGFATQGRFLGLGNESFHTFSAEAIDEVEICSFSRDLFDQALERFPQLTRVLLERARDELTTAYDQMLLLGRKTARERVASLLLGLAGDALDADAHTVSLPMTRNDIADYLGLTLETVSRVLTELRKQHVIAMPNAHLVEIIDRATLSELAYGP